MINCNVSTGSGRTNWRGTSTLFVRGFNSKLAVLLNCTLSAQEQIRPLLKLKTRPGFGLASSLSMVSTSESRSRHTLQKNFGQNVYFMAADKFSNFVVLTKHF